MKSAAKHSVLVTLGLFGGLFVLFGLVGCDGYLVSICNFDERPGCPGLGTDEVIKPGSDMPPSVVQNPNQLPPSNGPERSFEPRTTIPLDASHKFVGMYDRDKLLFVVNSASVRWEAANLDQTSSNCTNCPTIPNGFSFTEDSFYTSSGNFYFFQYKNNKKLWKFSNDKLNEVDNVILRKKPTNSFAHPSIEALMFSSTDKNKNTTTALINSNGNYTTNESEIDSKFFLIGDFDFSDNSRNGSEIVIFSDSGPTYLRHQNESTQDPLLLSILQRTIETTKVGDSTSVQAAFIASLNGDAFPDLIYARDGKVYVTSYKGRNWSLMVPIFEHWKEPVLSISGETIKSIIAVELTKDSYEDLVIETDKAVHVYQNIPKTGL